MSKAASSPTARLFQSSRLFSLPRPLPQPALENTTSTGVYKSSDTATLPYPTHQAITTPASSLSRGDWGLKRPLPAKTTRQTSTPVIKVRAQDTFEHITDFASSADHVLTERKWAEMGIPMVLKKDKTGELQGAPMSVYESHIDITDPDALAAEAPTSTRRRSQRRSGQVMEQPKPRQRWKYTGPWIAGMAEGEFNEYLRRSIEGRKTEWREFLRRREWDARVKSAQRKARDAGDPLSPHDLARLRVEVRPTDAGLEDLEKALRDEHMKDKLGSTLTAYITQFLDLPTVPTAQEGNQAAFANIRTEALLSRLDQTLGKEGPPSTHPGAGLSHLRTGAVLENHPLYGPQRYGAPIQARVLRARHQEVGANEFRAKLGVGGVVADDSETETRSSRTPRGGAQEADPAHQLDADAWGGNKLWVHPERATVDEKGRIKLEITRADDEALKVKKGEVDSINEAKENARNAVTGTGRFAATPVGTFAPAPAPRVQGFDRELGGRDVNGEGMAKWMRGMMGREAGM